MTAVFIMIFIFYYVVKADISHIFTFKCYTGNISSSVFNSFPSKSEFRCFILCSRNKECFAVTYSSDKQCFFHETKVPSCSSMLVKTYKVYIKIFESNCTKRGKYDFFGKTCHCFPGYYGKDCEHDVCLPNPCQNFGYCHRMGNQKSFKCICVGGYYGKFCHLNTTSRQFDKELTHDNPVQFGDVYPFAFCDHGYFANGIQLRVETGGIDNTGVNNLRLQCQRPYDNTQGDHVQSGITGEGSWFSKTFCPLNMFIVGFRVRASPYKGILGDDNAITDVKFKCQKFLDVNNTFIEIHPQGGLKNGIWGSWSENCNSTSAVCGVKTKIESSSADKSGLNEVKLKCCSYFSKTF
ncbi:unnamed protein product [Dimorphilus gyrociliatus]|uniref:EGF-like domain-containing protein n=1 Tax=Dimorphilus gyrociliatus TaxID=2664684 RepID=A0A7I8VHL6_9ANNE|nr:unnamed protein product [Dimorphilus gyrociliatus]